jgi:hypothetical protein
LKKPATGVTMMTICRQVTGSAKMHNAMHDLHLQIQRSIKSFTLCSDVLCGAI